MSQYLSTRDIEGAQPKRLMDQRGKRRIVRLPHSIEAESVLHSRSFQPSPFSAINQES